MRSMMDLRRINIEKSKVAGAPVGEHSEIERPRIKRIKKRH